MDQRALYGSLSPILCVRVTDNLVSMAVCTIIPSELLTNLLLLTLQLSSAGLEFFNSHMGVLPARVKQ